MFKYKKSRLSAFFAAINIVLADIGGKKTTYIISTVRQSPKLSSTPHHDVGRR